MFKEKKQELKKFYRHDPLFTGRFFRTTLKQKMQSEVYHLLQKRSHIFFMYKGIPVFFFFINIFVSESSEINVEEFPFSTQN